MRLLVCIMVLILASISKEQTDEKRRTYEYMGESTITFLSVVVLLGSMNAAARAAASNPAIETATAEN